MISKSDIRYRKCETKPSMASMIDVIFLLLIFFVLATHPTNVLSKLAIERPTGTPGEPDPTLLEIVVTDRSLVMNGRTVTLNYIDSFLEEIGKLSTECRISVICGPQSQHSKLIKVLDTCAAHDFHRISLSSRVRRQTQRLTM